MKENEKNNRRRSRRTKKRKASFTGGKGDSRGLGGELMFC
jgi:hypothetical protein